MQKVDAYIPCCNNETTLASTIASVRAQSVSVDRILVIDDGSCDQSAVVAEQAGCEVIRLGTMMGRGAARARAFDELSAPYILGVDATNKLDPDFLKHALPLLADSKVAAVCGRIHDAMPRTLADRWRARHLFNQWRPADASGVQPAGLATYGCVARLSAVLEVGNFNQALRHSEDAELGSRLEKAGYVILMQPKSILAPLCSNPLHRVLERYWRWHAGNDERCNFRDYLRAAWYGAVVLVRRDADAGDWASIPISLFVAHYQFWRSATRRLAKTKSSLFNPKKP